MPEIAPSTYVLGVGGLRRARKLSRALQIITRRLNDPQNVININNAPYIVPKTGTHWGEGHIRKKKTRCSTTKLVMCKL